MSSENTTTSQIHRAAQNGHADSIRRLIADTTDITVDTRDAQGRSALHFVPLGKGHKSSATVVDALIELGAELDARDDKGQTALHIAAVNGNATVCQLLLDRGADVNARDENNQTALHRLANAPESMVYPWLEVVNVLLASGADVTLRDENGATAGDYIRAADNSFRSLRLYPDTAEWSRIVYDGHTGDPVQILLDKLRALSRTPHEMRGPQYLLLEAEMPDAVADDEDRIVRFSALYQYWFRAHRLGIEELTVNVRLSTVSTVGKHKGEAGRLRVLARK